MIPRLPRRLLWTLALLMGMTAHGWAGNGFTIKATAFADGQPIPARYALSSGSNESPELQIRNAPGAAKSLVLIVDDPDSPSGLWTHWLVWNLSPDTHVIHANDLPDEARVGKNSFGDVRYDGPSPPSGTHHYYFRLYALDTTLSLPTGASRADLDSAMNGHVVGATQTVGTYSAAP